jgi:hypothetical protein
MSGLLTCPGVFELTAKQDKCDFEASCPGVFEHSGRLVLIGKKVDMPEILARLGPDENAVEIGAGIVERALAARRSEAGADEKDAAAMELLSEQTGEGEKQCL